MNCFERLRDIREDHDLTQTDVAKILNTTRQRVSKWETGTQMMGVINISYWLNTIMYLLIICWDLLIRLKIILIV